MSEPSALDYARYFDLTQDHTDTDLLSSLDSLPPYASTQPPNCDIEQDCPRLLQAFETAANEYLTLANDEPLRISQDVTTFLQNCTKKAKPNLYTIYQNLLPDPFRLRKHKLKVPLLLTGGGDVHKDVHRVRKGTNLDRALDDLLEDHEETSRSRKRNDDHPSSTTTTSEILDLVQKELEKAKQKEVVEVSTKSLQYLKGAFCNSMSKEQVTKMISEALPSSKRSEPCGGKEIAEDDVELDLDEDSDREHINSSLATPKETRSNPLITQQGISGLLPCLDMAVEDESFQHENFRSTSLVSADETMDNLLSQFMIHDFKEPEDEFGPEKVNAKDFLTAEPRRKRQKLMHEPDDRIRLIEIPSPTLPPGRLATKKLKPYWQAQKVAVPRIELAPTKLPLLDRNDMLVSVSSATWKHDNPTDIEQSLPLVVPSMEEVMTDLMPANIAPLQRYLGPSKPIVTSDKLLFKEPGLRVLDKTDRDEDELFVDDYPLDEWKPNASTETNLQISGKSQTDFENHNSRVKIGSNKRKQMPGSNSTHRADVEAQTSIVEAGLRSPPPDQQPLSPHQVPKNSFDQPMIDFKFKCGMPTRTEPEPQVNKRIAQYADTNTTSKGKIKETVAKLLSRLSRPDIKPTKSGHTEIDSSFSESDSLSSFLDLRGKKFKAPTQRICKEIELSEDPIQSTQNSMIEQVGIDNDKSTTSQQEEAMSSKEASELLPTITALNQPKTIILNSDLLQRKPLLVQFLERTNPGELTLIYRELNQYQGRGPDIILNPTACLLVTNLQALNQRPLPGQKTATGLSNVHDHVAMLSQRYPIVVILVHYLVMVDIALAPKQTSSMASFASFCNQLTTIEPHAGSNVVPVWIPCTKASSTSDAVNSWAWQTIQRYAFDTLSPPRRTLTADVPSTLVQDETLWEIFLVRAGLNPMAAQIVIRSLKRPTMRSQISTGTDPNWGLRKLVSMERSERHDMFDKLIGRHAVNNLNHLLQDS